MRINRNRISLAYALEVCWNRSLAIIKERSGEPAIGPISVKPQVIFTTERGNCRKGINRSSTDRACRPDDEEWRITSLDVCLNLASQCGGVHAQLIIYRNPANGIGAQAKHVGGLVNPGVGLARGIDSHLAAIFPAHTGDAQVPGGFCLAGREKTHKIAHITAAYQ